MNCTQRQCQLQPCEAGSVWFSSVAPKSGTEKGPLQEDPWLRGQRGWSHGLLGPRQTPWLDPQAGDGACPLSLVLVYPS